MKNTRKNAGNAFVIILILIALLAALTITLTRMGSTTQDVSEEQARVIASQVMRQARSVANAVDSLISRGCSVTELSFENSLASGYSNLQTPSSGNCKVFDLAGAGLSFPPPPTNSNDNSDWFITGYHPVTGVGAERESGTCCAASNISEIIMSLRMVNLNVCKAINLTSGITTSFNTNPPAAVNSFNTRSNNYFRAPSSAGTVNNFSTTLTSSSTARLQSTGSPDTATAFWDKKAGCFEAAAGYLDASSVSQSGTGKYFFYQVLYER